jgi:ABC-type transporter Mla subunit MlaD
MVRASQTILATTASQDRQLAAALRAAPGVLAEAERTAEVAADVTPRVSRTLDAMLPVTEKLEPSMRAVRRVLPAMSRLLTATSRFSRDAAEPTGDLTTVLGELQESRAALETIASRVDAITGALVLQKDRVPQVASMVAGMFGQQDDRSALGRTLVERFEDPKPQNFGLPDTPAGMRSLRRQLPGALEPICGDLAASCARLVLDGELPEREARP